MRIYFEQIMIQIATLAGIGKLPASGTVGSAIALLSGILIARYEIMILLVLTICLAVIGCIAADIYSRKTASHDASEIIIDEVVGQWVVLLFIAHNTEYVLYSYLLAFLLFRLFDITKWGPVGWAERIPDGIGVMADDLIAAGLAVICILAIEMIIFI